ncbi:MAG: mannose-1-phosphate guanylyltransferase [Candidatus Methylacidiphilales bacterium]|nr:sugar phosphate nucleotidyltransferase [Candidatus Methylacidiphilales bacterium]
MNHLYVCILAGGSGERFWPMSRKTLPKHLLRIVSDATLIELTVQRLEGLVPHERIFILTNEAQLDATRAALPMLPESQIIAEPAKRDTAPACALGTALIRSIDPEGIIALLPADALVHDAATFRKQFEEAAQVARAQDAFLTFGIPPRYPATGFGYLEMGKQVDTSTLSDGSTSGPITSDFRHVGRFVEKPNMEKAEKYLQSGRFLWNAGMFVWKAETFLKEARLQQPELADFIEQMPSDRAAQHEYLERVFPTLPKISVDYAIMENAASVICCRAEYDWDDVGAWTALPDHLGVDDKGNTVQGESVLHDSNGNIIIARKLVALCGVSDLIIVETDDAILICPRDRAQDIKSLLPLLPAELR